jgi:hypothetical protein
MRHSFLALSVVVFLVGVVSAQEVTRPDQNAPREDRERGWRRDHPVASQKLESREDSYTIEIKVLEGRGLPQEVPADARPWIAAPAKRGYDLRGRMAPPARAILPNPVALPEGDNRHSDRVPKHDEDLQVASSKATSQATDSARSVDNVADPWDRAQREPGVTVLAAPKLAVIAGQSGVIQIQTQQIFTYLQPLGDGKFQAKHTDFMELGMKFVLGVQPVEEDNRSVEVSPLEIQLAVLDGREPVDGLDLDVGKPIIATRSLKTTAKMKLGVTRMIPIPSGPKTQAALLLRINRIDPADVQPILPRSVTSSDRDESSP